MTRLHAGFLDVKAPVSFLVPAGVPRGFQLMSRALLDSPRFARRFRKKMAIRTWHDASHPKSGGFDARRHDLKPPASIQLPRTCPELCPDRRTSGGSNWPAIVLPRRRHSAFDPNPSFHCGCKAGTERAKQLTRQAPAVGSCVIGSGTPTHALVQCQRFQDQGL